MFLRLKGEVKWHLRLLCRLSGPFARVGQQTRPQAKMLYSKTKTVALTRVILMMFV